MLQTFVSQISPSFMLTTYFIWKLLHNFTIIYFDKKIVYKYLSYFVKPNQKNSIFLKALSIPNKSSFFCSPSSYTWIVQSVCIKFRTNWVQINFLSLLFSPGLCNWQVAAYILSQYLRCHCCLRQLFPALGIFSLTLFLNSKFKKLISSLPRSVCPSLCAQFSSDVKTRSLPGRSFKRATYSLLFIFLSSPPASMVDRHDFPLLLWPITLLKRQWLSNRRKAAHLSALLPGWGSAPTVL